MKRHLALLAILSLSAEPAGAATATFRADTATELNNPERGWYFRVGPGETCTSVLISVRDGVVDAQAVRWVYYEANPASFNGPDFNTDMACVRAAGMKIILSEVYCSSSFCDEGVTIDQVEAQLAAMAPYVQANRDVIAISRVGVIGGWGEGASWAGGTVPATVRTRVRDAVVAMTPAEIPIVHRNPPYLQQWYPQITPDTAFNGSESSRVGIVNDCFLSQPDDHYTYPGSTSGLDPDFTTSAASQRAFAAARTEFAESGAETCDGGNNRLACSGDTTNDGLPAGIMNEGPRYHLSYMHRGYFDGYMNAWISDGCYASVNNLMGYRLQFDAISHPDAAGRGTLLTVTLKMRNYGWARVSSPRQVKARLVKASASDIVCAFVPQLRTLPSQATVSSTLRAQCAVPASAASGTYSVYLEMPDIYPTTEAIRGYKIRPANADAGGQAWDDTDGRWATGTTVTVN